MSATKEKRPRRVVAKPRLLTEVKRTITEYDLGVDQPIGVLLDAIRDDIVKAAEAQYE